MISVCIATYNGEKYIAEQIRSILPQLGEDDEILVSDDNSTDSTLDIIKEIHDYRIRIVEHKRSFVVKRHSNGYYCTNNFSNAIKNAKGDYIFLSDQDDIWMPNKVEIVMEKLQDNDFVMTNFSVIDNSHKIRIEKYFKTNPLSKNWFRNFNKNVYFGCCIAMKATAIKKYIPIPHSIVSYDIWLGTLHLLDKKELCFVNQPLLMYRRHGSNISYATESHSKNSIIFKIFWRIQFLIALFKFIKKDKHNA